MFLHLYYCIYNTVCVVLLCVGQEKTFFEHRRGVKYQCKKNNPVPEKWWNPDYSSSSFPYSTLCVGLMFCLQAVGRAGGWRYCGGREALRVTSCSILFLCRCASARRPSGLTLHCSSNNCCGTPNICKPPLLLARLGAGLLLLLLLCTYF